MADKRVCVVTGVGPGNGQSIVQRFAREGYRVAMIARSQERLDRYAADIDNTRGYACDVGNAAEVEQAFRRIRDELGPADVLVHNAGTGSFSSFLDTDPDDLRRAFETNTMGLLLCGQQAARDMVQRGHGAVVVIGATASVRGGAGFAGFAPAKAGQRILAQSMARSLGPKGVHVSYVVIDGVIDTPRTREWMSDKPDDFFLKPDDIAKTVLHLAEQPRSAWTFELDLRPYAERW